MKRRRAPESPATRTAPATAKYSPAAPAPSSPARRKVRRDRSDRRGRIRRATICHRTRGTSTSATAMCTHSPGCPAMMRTSPVAYPTPATNVITTSAASSSDTHRVARPRRSPVRTTRLFHGTRNRITSPAMPCAMAAHRPLADPIATIATPVPNTSTSATSKVWLVIRPAGARKIRRNPSWRRAGGMPADITPSIGQYSFLMLKYDPRMVPASFDRCRANLNREASSSGISIPSDSLNPTARLPASSMVYITLIDRPLS